MRPGPGASEPCSLRGRVGDRGVGPILRLGITQLFRKGLGSLLVPVASKRRSLPGETFGFLGAVFAVDQPASSARTRERFDWRPAHPSLLEDLDAGDYPA